MKRQQATSPYDLHRALRRKALREATTVVLGGLLLVATIYLFLFALLVLGS